ncbi:hypothetical protein [Acidithiobacillus sulfuriphilus]|uniref:hypothetical protein n=1 Tax=Acidithiobacillus sulfuriphilus TaxID=1867749 RepID=UPI003F61A5FF
MAGRHPRPARLSSGKELAGNFGHMPALEAGDADFVGAGLPSASASVPAPSAMLLCCNQKIRTLLIG